MSWNGRLPQLLIDPAVDLTQQRRDLFDHADWILPLDSSGSQLELGQTHFSS